MLQVLVMIVFGLHLRLRRATVSLCPRIAQRDCWRAHPDL